MEYFPTSHEAANACNVGAWVQFRLLQSQCATVVSSFLDVHLVKSTINDFFFQKVEINVNNKYSQLTVGITFDMKNSRPFERVYIFPREAIKQKFASINKKDNDLRQMILE
jgi:hypothetical protein